MKKLPTPNRPRSSGCPVSVLKKPADRSMLTPAPSPTPSADIPPRCGIAHNACSPSAITSWDWVPSLRVMKPTPHALCSTAGS